MRLSGAVREVVWSGDGLLFLDEEAGQLRHFSVATGLASTLAAGVASVGSLGPDGGFVLIGQQGSSDLSRGAVSCGTLGPGDMATRQIGEGSFRPVPGSGDRRGLLLAEPLSLDASGCAHVSLRQSRIETPLAGTLGTLRWVQKDCALEGEEVSAAGVILAHPATGRLLARAVSPGSEVEYFVAFPIEGLAPAPITKVPIPQPVAGGCVGIYLEAAWSGDGERLVVWGLDVNQDVLLVHRSRELIDARTGSSLVVFDCDEDPVPLGAGAVCLRRPGPDPLLAELVYHDATGPRSVEAGALSGLVAGPGGEVLYTRLAGPPSDVVMRLRMEGGALQVDQIAAGRILALRPDDHGEPRWLFLGESGPAQRVTHLLDLRASRFAALPSDALGAIPIFEERAFVRPAQEGLQLGRLEWSDLQER